MQPKGNTTFPDLAESKVRVVKPEDSRKDLRHVPVPPKFRRQLRDIKHRAVESHLLQIERARRAIIAGDADVLMLGDSSFLFGAPGDAERIMIPGLVRRELDSARVVAIAGGGLAAGVYGDILRLFAQLDQRPAALIVSIVLRNNSMTHVTCNPSFRYDRLRADLVAQDPHEKVRSFGRGAELDETERAAFERLEVETRWGGRSTIGSYRTGLRGKITHPMPHDVQRRLFDYYHGEILTPDHPGLTEVRRFGQTVRDYAVPTAFFWAAPPLEHGESLYPGEFETHVRANLAQLQAALTPAGETTPVLIEAPLEDADFAESSDGTEHYALSGRRKIAQAVVAELRAKR